MYKVNPADLDGEGTRLIMLEADSLPVAMFCEANKSRYRHLLHLKGVRLYAIQTTSEADQYRHLEPSKKERAKKDKTTPLFPDLPNVYKG